MKTKHTIIIAVATITLAYNGCGGGFKAVSNNQGSDSLSSVGGGDPLNPGPITPSSIVAGAGNTVSGTGSLSVTTTEGIVAKIQNGLQNNVNSQAGNFAKGLAQVKSNLPKVSDPTKATGYDQTQLLVYAACSDLTTGTTPLMQSKYSVTKAGTVAANKTALISAGMTMLDQYTAGLASQGTAVTQVNTALSTLVDQIGAVTGNTSTIAFMSVCIAANSAGTSLLGF